MVVYKQNNMTSIFYRNNKINRCYKCYFELKKTQLRPLYIIFFTIWINCIIINKCNIVYKIQYKTPFLKSIISISPKKTQGGIKIISNSLDIGKEK